MNAQERREAIYALLQKAGEPVTGTALAHTFQVSRQVIVQDVALLRACGRDIVSTADGYWVRPASGTRPTRVFACRHVGMEALRHELEIIVDHGGLVRDIVVEHPVYGELRGLLMLSSRKRVEDFIQKPGWQDATPLSSLTGGIHLHTVEAETEAELDAMDKALREAGFLMS